MRINCKATLKAFTLIEMMVVIAIIGIVSALMLVNLNNGRVQRDLETSAKEFVSMVREAQNDALTGKQIVGSTTPCAQAFRVYWSVGSSADSGSAGTGTYRLDYYEKNNSGDCSYAGRVGPKTFNNGVVFTGPQTSMAFGLPNADVYDKNLAALSAQSPNYISVVLMKQPYTHVVCIYSSGAVTDRDGSTCPSAP
jgi:prepilin-type N-terminal cleavage/methylation domain-containing protein